MPNLSFTPVQQPVGNDDAIGLDWYISEVIVKNRDSGDTICRLQQGTGHCCGATYITQMGPTLLNCIDDLITEITAAHVQLSLRWSVQKQLFFYLSEETEFWDAPIRSRQDVKALYSFKNYATKPYSGSVVTLFVLEL